MSATDHPTYPNPIIQEALCEIRFRPQGETGNPLAFSLFFDKVKAEFPYIEAVPVPMVSVQIGPGGVQNAPSLPQVIRYRHLSRPLLIQLSENRIVLNIVGNYPGWSQFQEDISSVWQKIVEVIQPEAIRRVALRYINRIERSVPNETLSEWLVSTDYIAEAVLRSQPSLLSQVQVSPNDTERINVVVGEIDSPNNINGAFLFDIDRAVEQEMPADLSTLLSETERLHQDVWRVFSDAKSDKLERLLKGELL